ncbi:MAG: 4Fe-4S dicluster domain-containing protein [Trueperaceae bacterium]|nr:MAG: 4Fe-4S dicluster domain-containing protein [Trueperaceae bacterium]
MSRMAMAIDLAACVGCAACSVACKHENEVPIGVNRLWIRNTTIGTFPNLVTEFRPEQCLHCENPPCVPVCPTGCCFVRADGIVDIEPMKCIGCSACIAACPYDARYMHPDGYVSKCDYCKHRVEKGELPACVTTCPTLCRSFGDLDDPDSDVSIALRGARRVDLLRPGLGTGPKLYYLNAPAKFGLVGEEGQRSS